MRIHRNAKKTPAGRKLLVDRVIYQGWTIQAATRAVGVSGHTGSKWLRRYRTGVGETLAAIVALRYERLTTSAITHRLQVPR